MSTALCWLAGMGKGQVFPRPHPARLHVRYARGFYRAKTRPLFHAQERDLGWGALVHGPIDVIPIPGNHDTIVREPHIQLLAAALRSAMVKLESNETASNKKGLEWHA